MLTPSGNDGHQWLGMAVETRLDIDLRYVRLWWDDADHGVCFFYLLYLERQDITNLPFVIADERIRGYL